MDDLAVHAVCNNCTSVVEIEGIRDLDLVLSLGTMPEEEGGSVDMSVRKFVMTHTIEGTGKHPFLAVAPTDGGGMAAFYSEYPGGDPLIDPPPGIHDVLPGAGTPPGTAGGS